MVELNLIIVKRKRTLGFGRTVHRHKNFPWWFWVLCLMVLKRMKEAVQEDSGRCWVCLGATEAYTQTPASGF